jgi:tRNA threonylcarbamoyladenosine biosynthesis protein TsaB
MKILGIDTTTKYLCLGVYDDGKVYEYNLQLGRKHSTLLVVTIKRVVDALGWRLKDIDYFACGLGPGSFTGVRIGVATIKGLAFSLGKPVVGISTLDVLSGNIDMDGIIVPAVDAKRNLIYCSMYRRKNGVIKRIAPYMLLSLPEFLKKIKTNSLLFGDALGLYKEQLLLHAKRAVILDKDYWFPRGGNIMYSALERLRGKKINNAFNVTPMYLYPKECQIKSGKK